MAIRKPTLPAAKSSLFADFLSNTQEVKIKNGDIVEGTVSVVKGDDVFISISYKSEGKVDLAEFAEGEAVPGARVSVKVITLEDDRTGMVRLSKKAADEQIRWQKVQEKYSEGCIVHGVIKEAVHGGMLVDVDGLQAFLPGSQVDDKPVRDLAPYVGQEYDFKVIKISEERKNIIISRRELIEGINAEKKAELLASLQEGEIRKGRVKNITPFGAFVDLDGIDGLLHIADMSWGRIKNPEEVLKIGQELNVMVLKVEREKERISLGLKQTTPNPWDTIAEQFPVGSRVKGKVVNLTTYGAFVEIAPDIEGLVHISEFNWTKRVARPEDVLTPGDEITVAVVSVDPKEQKIGLSIRETQDNPWDTVRDRYPVGSRVKGKVRNFTSYGAFVELEDGIDGMIHVSDMSWTRKIAHPTEVLKKGDVVEAVVLEVKPEEQRISLSLKEAQGDPWNEIASKYPVGMLVKGKVSKIASFGAFVQLEDGVDGLVHISQISDQRVDKVSDVLQKDQEIEARVVKVSRSDRRIGLSIKAVSMSEDEVKALENENLGDEVESEQMTKSSENLGGLASAFDDAFQSVEWQPGEENK